VTVAATHQDAPGVTVITAIPEVAADHTGLADYAGVLDGRTEPANRHSIGVSGERTGRENDRRSGDGQIKLTYDSPP